MTGRLPVVPGQEPGWIKRGKDGCWYALFQAPLPDGQSCLRYVMADSASAAAEARARALRGEAVPSWRLRSATPGGTHLGRPTSAQDPPAAAPLPPPRVAVDRRWLAAIGVVGVVVALIVGFPIRAHAERSTHRRRRGDIQNGLVPDVFTTPAVASYLAGRSGSTTAALYDLRTGQTFVLDPSVVETTASIMKVDILETLLRQSQQSGQPLTPTEQALATTMIENSDDNAATTLWSDAGGNTAMTAFNTSIGMRHTVMGPPDVWGLSTTTADDQISLLRRLVSPASALTLASRQYELSLMENVEDDQTWGISNGVPSGVTVAIKDGWDPLGTGTNWQINTEGWVDGDGRDDLLAILTVDEPNEYDAIQTVDELSSLVWNALPGPG